ncbi:hypothetical protein Nepgr_022345 [Nepenthes gracilis]|uniref:NAC domain-containing protein n=1 Tax=Nepenthes gracilis TaxID=150966 RepID=A0AAD3XXZ5_NEPGR|nr:hypothetical protein Nepgr_022345 [Nepenthes gracilis]
MLTMEEVMREWNGEEVNERGLPPGFRFHPTDEELITFYLATKVFHGSFSGVDIAEVDLNRCEPWELPDRAKMGEREWYFFSMRDRKYPTGLRTNRATGAGYWKATGKDREVYGASSGAVVGMKKTLVFYRGRAPRGVKTRWVMHEYRLHGPLSYRHSCKEEWVICRIFHKRGEKKSGIFQGQEQLPSSPIPNTSTSLPPCPEPTPTIYSHHHPPFFIQQHPQESHLKSLLNPPLCSPSSQSHIFAPNALQAPLMPLVALPPSTTAAAAASTTTINKITDAHQRLSPYSINFKSFLSHQDYYCTNGKEEHHPAQQLLITTSTDNPRQYKTEANFYHAFQLPLHPNNNINFHSQCVDKTSQLPPHSLPQPLPHPLPPSQYLSFGLDCSMLGLTADMAALEKTAGLLMADPHIKSTGESWQMNSVCRNIDVHASPH